MSERFRDHAADIARKDRTIFALNEQYREMRNDRDSLQQQLAALREENERLRRDLDSVSAALISADTYLSGHCNGPCCVDPVMPITKESTK